MRPYLGPPWTDSHQILAVDVFHHAPPIHDIQNAEMQKKKKKKKKKFFVMSSLLYSIIIEIMCAYRTYRNIGPQWSVSSIYLAFNQIYMKLQTKGAGIFFGRGVPNLQKVGVDKTATPLFRQQKFYEPPSPIHLTP